VESQPATRGFGRPPPGQSQGKGEAAATGRRLHTAQGGEVVLEILLIIVIVLLLTGGGYGYSRRGR
jgi:hypothetical protein